MGFSSPKQTKPEPAPPPVTTSNADAAYTSVDERRKQRRRDGYGDTLITSPDFLGKAKKDNRPKTLIQAQ